MSVLFITHLTAIQVPLARHEKVYKLVHSKEDLPFDHSSQKERSESTPRDDEDAFGT